MFVNKSAFNDHNARQQAMGVDTRSAALVDVQGKTTVHPQTGGMIAPVRHELFSKTILFRFADGYTSLERAVTGGWWLGSREFDRICNFAKYHDIHPAMAVRMLCCVPPEWSDMGLLVRARVDRPLLAYRGLGNDVSTQHDDGGWVRMKASNDFAERRLHQLFIPGLVEYAKKTPEQVIPGALTLERVWPITEKQANGGWIYL